MRFLRMLTNAIIAGALGAAYLTILVLQLNPSVPLASASTGRWFATFSVFYGVNLALLFYVLMLLREFLSVGVFSPAWISVRLLAWLSSSAAAVAAALMWLNVRGLSATLLDSQVRRFTAGAAATTASAVLLLAIAVAHYSFGRRGSKVGAALLGIAITGSLALPLAARGRATVPPPVPPRTTFGPLLAPDASPRVTLIMLDGATLDYVWPRAAEGRLPNFARLLDDGASMDLATIRPTQPDPVWAAVATGMYPAKNGVRSAASYFALGDGRPVDLLPDYCFSHTLVQLGIVRSLPKSSAAWRVRPLWAVLNDYGISTGVVRWPLTYPVEPVRGYLVSDRFHQLLGSADEPRGTVYPPEEQPVVHDAFASAESTPPLPPAGPTAGGADISAARWDPLYARALAALDRDRPARFTALRYQGLDIIGHHVWQYAQPPAFSASVTDEDRAKYAPVLDRYYGYIDRQIGIALERLAPGDLLLVVSGFGMEPVDAAKRALGRLLRQPQASGAHDRAPDGFLLAYGSAVERGRRRRGSIVDVAPTVLYYLGVPIGRDMDGFTRADLFSREFTAQRPIRYIPSHGRNP
jgi:hypothetical protein